MRLARGTSGPVNAFGNAAEVHEHVCAALPTTYQAPTVGDVAQWLEVRVAERGAVLR